MAGYTIGATDITKYDEFGHVVVGPDGQVLERKAQGITGGLSAGYILRRNAPINIGLRYQHTLVTGDNALNMLSLRLSWALSFGRREY